MPRFCICRCSVLVLFLVAAGCATSQDPKQDPSPPPDHVASLQDHTETHVEEPTVQDHPDTRPVFPQIQDHADTQPTEPF